MGAVASPAGIKLLSASEEALAAIPDAPGVFLLHAGPESRYLAKTGVLRRRILRTIRMFRLQEVLTSVEYWPTACRFESALLHYELARSLFPDTYPRLVRLPRPAYVRVTLANAFPRVHVSTRLGSRGAHFGPFRTRADAEVFEAGMLDLFQIRRCQEDLAPRPDHPGCIYGEMNMCLRPCQAVVSIDEYGGEVGRVVEFLRTRGASLLSSTAAARERLSEEMNFEQAAQQHRAWERINNVVAMRSDLVGDVERLYGIAILPSLEPRSVRLQFLWKGAWLAPQLFEQDRVSGSLDHHLRQMVDAISPSPVTLLERQEHLALLTRWFYSSGREGEWIGFDDPASVPWRRLVRAISRVAGAAQESASP
jgi:excinuclease ABC subunit C